MRVCSLALGVLVASCAGGPPPQLHAGVATVPLGAPVGVSLGGYSARSRIDDPVGSPWAKNFAASRGVHTLPTARAIWLEKGDTRVAVVRMDLCLVTQTLRERAKQHARSLGLEVELMLVGTHTHSGPARYFPPIRVAGTGNFDVAANGMDEYSPEIEVQLARAAVAAAQQAQKARRPVAVGVASVDASELNGDRRCENDGLYGAGTRDTALTVVRLDERRADGTLQPYTGFLHYPLHGTLLDDDSLLMTTDAPGALELYGSDRVGVSLLYLQGAAGDVSPSTGAHGHRGFQAVERLGRVAAEHVAAAFERAQPTSLEPTLEWLERPVPLGARAMGYRDGEFPQSGGIGCFFADGACGVATDPQKVLCLPLAKLPARQTPLTAIRLGPLTLLSLPGEPTTAFAREVRQAAPDAGANLLVVGYAQDHQGYLLMGDDYLRGGYEARVSPWGWRFGEYLSAQAGLLLSGNPDAPAWQPPDLMEVPASAAQEETAGTAALLHASGDIDRSAVAQLEFLGGDPALGVPEVWLERNVSGQFEPVMASAVRAVRGGPEIRITYRPSPGYREQAYGKPRRHEWVAEWETLPSTPLGSYRLVARGLALRDGARGEYQIAAPAFEVRRSVQAGAIATAAAHDGQVVLELRFPVPRSEAYRVADLTSGPSQGPRCVGGSAEVTFVSAGRRASGRLEWDANLKALKGVAPWSGEDLRLEVSPGGYVDGDGNTNGALISIAVKST